jgi:hypothetical protein
MAGDDDAGDELSDDDLAHLLDPDFAAGSAIREPTAGERAEQMVRDARRADLQRRLDEEAARKAEEERERRRQERRERGGRADRRGIRMAIGLFVVVALLAAFAFSLLRRRDATSSTSNASQVTPTSLARPDGYPPATKEASKPLGTPPPLPTAAGPYEFLNTQPHSTKPITWDPCRPIHYVINPGGAPPGGVQLIQDAVAKASAATGLQFQYEGTTTEKWAKDRPTYQPERYGQEWAPALIAWGTEETVPGLAGYIAGLTAPYPMYDLKHPNRELFVTGGTILDSKDLGVLIAAGHQDQARAIIQHEMGHLVGLDHVADPNQMMYSESLPKVLDWGAGDLHGLHILGTGECMPDV